MNKKLSKLLFTLLMMLLFSTFLLGQTSKLEVISFGLRAADPIVVNVSNSGEKITFDANNRSYFPYDLTIKFSSIENLLPKIFERKFIVHPGNNSLFVLNIVEKDQSTVFDYSIKYSIKLTNNPDLSFPYLIPIGQGRKVQLISFSKDDSEFLMENQFKLNPGDTIFAIRKGLITAIPNDESRVDRVIKFSSLEVLHSDGTLAVYRGLDKINSKLHPGQIIYAGQPVGMSGKNGILQMNLLSADNSESFKNLEIFYAAQNGKILSSKSINGVSVVHPQEIIEREMTAREIKKNKTAK